MSLPSTTCFTSLSGLAPCLSLRIAISLAGSGYPIDSLIIKRSSWDSGSICVPAEPTGFCVAITVNGFGSILVTPSTVTCPSSIASRSADCVFDDVLLISSARNRLHITAPSLNSNSWVLALYIENPITSDGSTSVVNCILFCLSAMDLENASASVVLPTPGISSISICPFARTAIITFSMISSLPFTAFLTSCITESAFS